jgi:EAL domain-containing protein (putative c-di-GMP-specific phosphodiesterase class I)
VVGGAVGVAVVGGADGVAVVGGADGVAAEGTDDGVDEAVAMARRVLAEFVAPVLLPGGALAVRVGIGVAVADSAGYPESLLRDADVALWTAKAEGSQRYRVADPAMAVGWLDRMRLEEDLRLAVARGELEVFYQPVVDLVDDRLLGMEALVRWRHPVRGLVGPDRFVPLAEKTGLLPAIDRWVLREACRAVAGWRELVPDLTVSVNVCAADLVEPSFVEDVVGALAAAGLPARALMLEMTESALVADMDAAAVILDAIAKLDVRVALDDFGTGYSSLAYLRTLPIDVIKIDRTFVADLGAAGADDAVTRAIVGLAGALKLGLVAEGVEERGQVEHLLRLGCDRAQGFLLARPMPHDMLEALLHRQLERLAAEVPAERSGDAVPAAG